jgi:diacylglycerol kinase (ATP)
LLILSFFLGLPWWFKLLLNLLWLVLLAVELLNTAIEAVVDLVSPGYHPLAKQAKDFGSAAVFCLLLAWIVAWGSAFWLLAA